MGNWCEKVSVCAMGYRHDGPCRFDLPESSNSGVFYSDPQRDEDARVGRALRELLAPERTVVIIVSPSATTITFGKPVEGAISLSAPSLAEALDAALKRARGA